MGQKHRSFTLLETLTVMSIIAILAAVVFVALKNTLQARERMRCLNSLRQWTLSLAMYASDHAEAYPPSSTIYNKSPEVASFMSNYLNVSDTVTYEPTTLPMAMCRSGVATVQNDANFIGWTLLAGFTDTNIFENAYAGKDFRTRLAAEQNSLAFISCITATAFSQWTGHNVNYQLTSTEVPQGQIAAWPDGHVRWVKFDRLEKAFTEAGGFDYYMPSENPE